MELGGDGDTICEWRTWSDLQRLCKKARGVEIGDGSNHPNYNVVEVGQDSKKSSDDLSGLAFI